MDWETPLPSSKMYHAAPAPGGGSSANPPVPIELFFSGQKSQLADCAPGRARIGLAPRVSGSRSKNFWGRSLRIFAEWARGRRGQMISFRIPGLPAGSQCTGTRCGAFFKHGRSIGVRGRRRLAVRGATAPDARRRVDGGHLRHAARGPRASVSGAIAGGRGPGSGSWPQSPPPRRARLSRTRGRCRELRRFPRHWFATRRY